MTDRTFLDAARCRAARALSSVRGAFDLPSIITGVVVVAILAAGVFAAVFGVIPFAQDKGAKQDLAAVRTAEGVAKAKDSRFLGSAGLNDSGYISARSGLAVGADEAGSCWVGFARSGAGTVFYATNETMDPKAYTSGTDTGCLSAEEQSGLITATGAAGKSPAAQQSAAPEPEAPKGYVASWGSGSGRVPANLGSGAMAGKDVSSVSGGSSHTCAVAEGKAYCWGANANGRLGDGTSNTSAAPVAVNTEGVLAGKSVTAVAGGGTHSCALADGGVYCWGQNSSGQLGNDGTTGSLVPVAVSVTGALNGKVVTAIAAGSFHTCALAEAKVYCWGLNGFGQLGNNTSKNSSVPTAVTTSGVLSGKDVTALGRGNDFTCAVAAGKAYCWGYNNSGQLGNGSTNDSYVPVATGAAGAMSGKTVTSITGGAGHACAVADGKAYCWGSGWAGQLGNSASVNSSNPVAVTTTGSVEGKTVTGLGSGDYHTCAVAGDSAYCWGYNSNGQLGDGTTANSPVPVAATGSMSGKTVIGVTGGYSSTAALYR